MTRFQQYVRDYDYKEDREREQLASIMRNENIYSIGIDVYADLENDTSMLALRTQIINPIIKSIRERLCILDNLESTLLMEIPEEMISECIFKEYNESLTEYLIMLANGINYKLLIMK